MYPLKRIYSRRAHQAWLERPGRSDLDRFTSSWAEVRDSDFWPAANWDDLRAAISFLTLMNKRDVLYFRGQQAHFDKCLPVLLRNNWSLAGENFAITDKTRMAFYAELPALQDALIEVVNRIGTPRHYILDYVPAAAASVLQHYELWPTHFVDMTRSLPVAVAFATSSQAKTAYLYVFAMPDLRGSITSDIDQHLTLARLEAVCPPAAKRPHHQDAYLVSRFPEPPLAGDAAGRRWRDWLSGTDLMRRLVAKFQLTLQKGWLVGTPMYDSSFLIPPTESDPFADELHKLMLPLVRSRARAIAI
jgi:hypothetical protein